MVYFEWNDAGKWFLRLPNGRFGSKFYNSYDELLAFWQENLQ